MITKGTQGRKQVWYEWLKTGGRAVVSRYDEQRTKNRQEQPPMGSRQFKLVTTKTGSYL
jgi:hypothetical protein